MHHADHDAGMVAAREWLQSGGKGPRIGVWTDHD